MTRVIATSDTHGSLPDIPECDILVLGGDLCPDHPIGKAARYSLPNVGSDFQLEFLDGPFRQWLEEVPAKHIVGIAGNHCFVFERMKTAVQELSLPWTYLEDEEVTIEGLRIYGTPYVPGLERWAFHASDMGLFWRSEAIPRGLDILITHGPPLGHLDFTTPSHGSRHVGDARLAERLKDARPKVTICGHVHEGYGRKKLPYTTLYNVSFNDAWGCPDNQPVLITEFLAKEEADAACNIRRLTDEG